MFSTLRQDSVFYILDKNTKPTLKIGKVIKINNTPSFGINPGSVDVCVRTDEEQIDFKQLPANLSTVNYGATNIIVSDNREEMINEIKNMIRASQQVLDNIDYHKTVVESGDNILSMLDPRFAKEKEQEVKINALEGKVNNIEQGISDMKAMMSELLTKR